MSGAHTGHALTAIRQRKGLSVVTICGKAKCSGNDFVERVHELSAGLRKLGVTAGERVALVGLNSALYLEWLLAVPCAGAIIAPLNHRWSVNEAAEAVNRIEACLLVFDNLCSDWWAVLKEQCPSLRAAVRLEEHCKLQPSLRTASLDLSRRGGGQIVGVVDSSEIRKYGRSVLKQEGEKLFTAPGGAALICFTSGTTGAPKAAVLSHRALVTQSMAKLVALQYNDQDVYLHAAPLCHIGGISSALSMLMAGATHVFLPRWRVDEAISAVEEHHVTTFIAVPTMLSDLISAVQGRSECSDELRTPFSGIRTLLVGGGSMGEMIGDVARLFPNAIIATAYGMTEAASSITFDIVREPTCQSGALPRWIAAKSSRASGKSSDKQDKTWGFCVGRPAPHLETRVVVNSLDPLEGNAASRSFQPGCQSSEGKTEREVVTKGEGQPSLLRGTEVESRSDETFLAPPFREGVIEVRGPNLFSGYFNQPDETAEVLSKDGWFRTGDVGYLDDRGMLWLCGRKKDMVKSGGENVHAAEVEAVLAQHPAVSAAAVVGLPDARLGEQVAALLVLRDGWTWEGPVKTGGRLLVAEDMRKHCNAQGLSRYKAPRLYMVTCTPLPVTSTGKVQKNLVRQQLLAHLHEAQHSLKVTRIRSTL